jgi:hypothetical protein
MFPSGRDERWVSAFLVAMVPSGRDERWVSAFLADQEADRENRHYDELAAEAEWHAAYEAGLTGPNPRPSDEGPCNMCGQVCNHLDSIHGLCDRCLDAATNATIAGQNRRAMLGYRVFCGSTRVAWTPPS